ncbi:MAG: OmpA family protein [Sulfurovum sp.]|nr:MAG: OmpA family protein [Sulfurovum sp.]
MEFLLVLLLASLSQPKSSIILLDSNKTSSIIISNDSGEVVLDKPNTTIEIADEKSLGEIKEISQESIDKRFGAVLSIKNLKPKSYFLYFEVGSHELTADSVKNIPMVLKTIEEKSPCKIEIIGHTDTVGDASLNTRISKERAEVIKKMFLLQGIDEANIRTNGYGESDLVVQTLDEVDEAKNRTVEIFIKWVIIF